MTEDAFPRGIPFAIGEELIAAIRSAPEFQDANVLDNPSSASDLKDGVRIVFFEDQGDRPGETKRQRVYSFSVGVISRDADSPRAVAHRDYRAAKRVLRDVGMKRLNSIAVNVFGTGLAEGEVRYRLENIDVGGGLVIGLFTLEYRDS